MRNPARSSDEPQVSSSIHRRARRDKRDLQDLRQRRVTEELSDPVDLLFGTQLGGGTDIHKALVYCESKITRPADTVMVLVSGLCEGGSVAGMVKAAARLKESGVRLIALLALSDEGKPWYDAENAATFVALGIPVFACTPDRFPDLMAAALAKKDLRLWQERK